MRALLLAGVVASGCVGVAKAALITATYDFVGTFSSGPNAAISGSVSLTYDTLMQTMPTVNRFTSSVLQSYVPVNAAENSSGLVTFGTSAFNGGYSITFGSNTFGLAFIVDSIGNVLLSDRFDYSNPGYNGEYTASLFSVTREVAVPEPASLVLLGLPLSLIGRLAVKRRRDVRES